MAVEGYEQLGNFDGEWTPSKREQRRQQQETEEMHRGIHERVRKDPPPRFSDAQYETLARLIQTARDQPRSNLMRWRFRLFCGHIVERTAHYTHKTVHAASMARACEVCGRDPATIVAGEALGLLEDPPPPPNRPATGAIDRSRVERSIARHEAEAARLRKPLEEDA